MVTITAYDLGYDLVWSDAQVEDILRPNLLAAVKASSVGVELYADALLCFS